MGKIAAELPVLVSLFDVNKNSWLREGRGCMQAGTGLTENFV